MSQIHADTQSQSQPNSRSPAPGRQARTRYRIEGVPGLWLSVCPSGKRTWYVRYQPGGRSDRVFRQYTIGDAKTVGLATATKAAHDVVNKVKVHDRDPVSERSRRSART